jgi:Putative N-acetylmannosamine-6-phosphate epimerase
MEYLNSIAGIRHGLIVSCQTEEGQVFDKPEHAAMFAAAAEAGGAVGIRTEGKENIKAIKSKVNVPIIGLIRSSYPDGSVLITPDFKDVDEIIAAGADIVAIDATNRLRPNGLSGFEFLRRVRQAHPSVLLLADVATFEEGIHAAELGADLVSTTLSGFTPETADKSKEGVDLELVAKLSEALMIPVIAEGRIWTPQEAAEAILAGAYAVVVGAAITRPTLITQMFVHELKLRTGTGESKD